MHFRKDKDYLSEVEKKLYKKDANFEYEKQTLRKQNVDVNDEWEEKEIKKSKNNVKFVQSPVLIKLFFISILFFLFASGVAVYRLFINPVISSPENVDILIQAPASVTGGEETQIQVIVTNNDKATIQDAVLEVSYPEGTDFIDIKEEDNRKFRKKLGPILPGQKVTETFNVVMFGEENSEKEFDINLEYRIEGSSATFSKNKSYAFVLTTSPVSLSFDIPEEVNSGEQVKLSIDVLSNLKTTLEDVQIVVEYPFGFSYDGANPPPTKDKNIWYLGNLPPSQSKKIEIVGKMNGEINELKAFKIFVGKRDKEQDDKIDIVYNSIIKTIRIEKPFLAIDFNINNNLIDDEVSVRNNERINVSINWLNNLPSRILNGEFTVFVSGPIVDENTIDVSKGFYRSSNNTITWNQVTDRSLSQIDPGERGTEKFSFETKSLFGPDGSKFINPKISLRLEFKGERVSPGFENEVVTFTKTKNIKVGTEIQLASYGTYYSGPFKNTGPLPPRVDQKTTYTITWSVINSANDISDAKISANLPIYVNWLNNVHPSNETMTFNETTGEIVWDIGKISKRSSKTASFQIELIPSLSQVGESPLLVSDVQFFGIDTFTNLQIRKTASDIDTRLTRDSQFNIDLESRVAP